MYLHLKRCYLSFNSYKSNERKMKQTCYRNATLLKFKTKQWYTKCEPLLAGYFLTHLRFLCRLQLVDVKAAPPLPICVALHCSPIPFHISLETLFCELKPCKVWLSHHCSGCFDFFNYLFCFSSLVCELFFFRSYVLVFLLWIAKCFGMGQVYFLLQMG